MVSLIQQVNLSLLACTWCSNDGLVCETKLGRLWVITTRVLNVNNALPIDRVELCAAMSTSYTSRY